MTVTFKVAVTFFVGINGLCTPQTRHRGLDLFGALTGFEPADDFVEFGRQFLAHFFAHLAHRASQFARVIFEPFDAACHGLHATLLRFRNADLGHAAADVLALAEGAGDRFLAILSEGEKHVKALVAVVADIVISRHAAILTELGQGGERFYFMASVARFVPVVR